MTIPNRLFREETMSPVKVFRGFSFAAAPDAGHGVSGHALHGGESNIDAGVNKLPGARMLLSGADQ